MRMDLFELCRTLQQHVGEQFRGRGTVDAREDSWAFGAAIEASVADTWEHLCESRGYRPEPRPGAREIFDLFAIADGVRVGVDVKTRNEDPGRYSDGGVCSVDNLLRFLAGASAERRGILVLLEVAHRKAAAGGRFVSSVTAAPLHVLPVDGIRIENLGSGQLRLEGSLVSLIERADWGRTPQAFLEPFVEIARAHYERVAVDAMRRRERLDAFARNEHTGFSVPRSTR